MFRVTSQKSQEPSRKSQVTSPEKLQITSPEARVTSSQVSSHRAENPKTRDAKMTHICIIR